MRDGGLGGVDVAGYACGGFWRLLDGRGRSLVSIVGSWFRRPEGQVEVIVKRR